MYKKSETTEQISLFQWAERIAGIVPALALMYLKGRELDIKQSAAVLSVAIDAYYAGKE